MSRTPYFTNTEPGLCRHRGHDHHQGKLSWAGPFQNHPSGWLWATFQKEQEFQDNDG